MRDAFDLDPSVVHLNHGSFGAVPAVVSAAQRRLRERAEANPMRFHRVELPALKERAREVAGDFLGVDGTDIALVRNVTQATATVLAAVVREGQLTRGDAIVLTGHTYESVRRLAVRTCRRTGASYEVVDCAVDADADAIVAAHQEALERIRAGGLRPRLVVVDHVASATAGVMPVRRLCDAARAAGALSFVDAAHVPGQLPARPAETGADFWAGTWHKWGFAARGTSALWASPEHRTSLDPLASGAPDDTPFPVAFDRTGTDDATGWCCLVDAVGFWNDCGGTEIAARGRALLGEGVPAVAASLPEVDTATPIDPAPCMRLVPLPDDVASTPAAATTVYERLSRQGFEVQVVPYAGRGYLRLSAAVYNELADYERLAKVVPDVLR